MFKFARAAAIAFALALIVAYPAGAGAEKRVKVSLLDMTAVFGQGQGPGMMGPGFGRGGPGMMGQGFGMMIGLGFGMGPGMMGMMSIRTNAATAKAGKITFDVTNLSRSILHEMVVVAVDSADAPLPYDYNTARVPEKQIKILGEAEEMEPNAEKTVTLDLKPGTYLLICNLPGHYAAGMWTSLTVTQ